MQLKRETHTIIFACWHLITHSSRGVWILTMICIFFSPLLAHSTPSGFSWLGHSILMHISLDSKRAENFYFDQDCVKLFTTAVDVLWFPFSFPSLSLHVFQLMSATEASVGHQILIYIFLPVWFQKKTTNAFPHKSSQNYQSACSSYIVPLDGCVFCFHTTATLSLVINLFFFFNVLERVQVSKAEREEGATHGCQWEEGKETTVSVRVSTTAVLPTDCPWEKVWL